MPDIGSMLRQEIARLSRRELRSEVRAARKASTQYRHHIAALRRQLSALERQVTTLQRRVADGHGGPARASPEEGGPKVRFSAGRLRTQRTKHGLTAGEYAKLLDVSEQTIYNWERGTHRPGQDRLAVIAELRGLGKRALQARLDAMNGKASSTKSASTKKRSAGKSASKKRATKKSATKKPAARKSSRRSSAQP
jgi:transcriptional regulator with XRE-family HTH domain